MNNASSFCFALDEDDPLANKLELTYKNTNEGEDTNLLENKDEE